MHLNMQPSFLTNLRAKIRDSESDRYCRHMSSGNTNIFVTRRAATARRRATEGASTRDDVRTSPFSRRCHFCPDPPLSSCSTAKSLYCSSLARNSWGTQKKSELLKLSTEIIIVSIVFYFNSNMWRLCRIFAQLIRLEKPLKGKLISFGWFFAIKGFLIE